MPRIGAAIAGAECDLDLAFVGKNIVFTLVIEIASEATALVVAPHFDANTFLPNGYCKMPPFNMLTLTHTEPLLFGAALQI